MYTKVTRKAGQNGPMWLYVGSAPIFLPARLGISYNYFSMMVVGYMGKLQAQFVLRRSPFQVIPTPCRWTQNLTCKVRRTRTERAHRHLIEHIDSEVDAPGHNMHRGPSSAPVRRHRTMVSLTTAHPLATSEIALHRRGLHGLQSRRRTWAPTGM